LDLVARQKQELVAELADS